MPGGGGRASLVDQLTKFVLEPGPEECSVKCRITRNCRGIDKGDASEYDEIGSTGMHFFMVPLFLNWIIEPETYSFQRNLSFSTPEMKTRTAGACSFISNQNLKSLSLFIPYGPINHKLSYQPFLRPCMPF